MHLSNIYQIYIAACCFSWPDLALFGTAAITCFLDVLVCLMLRMNVLWYHFRHQTHFENHASFVKALECFGTLAVSSTAGSKRRV